MNLLLTCAGRRNYIVEYFKSAVAPTGGRVYAGNSVADSTALLAADKGIVFPRLDDPSYMGVLLQVCATYEITAIVSLFDLELPLLAEAKAKLAERGIAVVVSSPSVIDICNDKWRTNLFLREHGFHSPRTQLNVEDALAAVKARDIQFPLIIKPRWGMGSIGIFEAENEEELRVLYQKVRRIIRRSYLSLAGQHAQNADVLIQEKVMGTEFGLDVVNDLDGIYVVTFVKKKIAMRAGETDGATTEDNPALRDVGERLGTCLRHVANLDVDVIVRGDRAYVLELNARFGGHYPFSHLAGADVPAAIVAWLTKTPPDPQWFRISYGVTAYKGLTIIPARSDIAEFNPVIAKSTIQSFAAGP